MLVMDTLLSMKVFRQVVECGSFVGAAERLSLSTAMTSKHLMHLEKHLGTRLLNRSSRSLSLTESGKLFFERCKGILEEVEEAELVVGSVGGVPRGTLHWFDLCGDRCIRAIRLFQDISGWTPHYTSSGVDRRYEPVCWGPRYIPPQTAEK